jgi:formylglycine-generating enzyme required for sulfatase activity
MRKIVPNSPFSEELLTIYHDGILSQWLSEGRTEEERSIYEKIKALPSNLTNSEILEKLANIFNKCEVHIGVPDISNYIEIKSVYLLKESRLLDIEKDLISLNLCQAKKCRIIIQMKINKMDNERFKIEISSNEHIFDSYDLHIRDYKIAEEISIDFPMPEDKGAQRISLMYNGISLYSFVIFVGCNDLIEVNGVSFRMILVKGGTFLMGATDEQKNRALETEKPVHKVTLSHYALGETLVTQDLWEAIMGTNPSCFKGYKRPVENVGWNYCQKFIKKLSQISGYNFRLPTEAEWEYAARGGVYSKGFIFSGSNKLNEVAWNAYNSKNGTSTVKTKLPNELGLFDMSGNVWEWCADWFGEYDHSPVVNPQGALTGSDRVIRGGSWFYDYDSCAVSCRKNHFPNSTSDRIGFRLAL